MLLALGVCSDTDTRATRRYRREPGPDAGEQILGRGDCCRARHGRRRVCPSWWALALPSKPQARGLGPAIELALRMGAIAILVVAATYAFIGFPEWGKGLKFQLTRGGAWRWRPLPEWRGGTAGMVLLFRRGRRTQAPLGLLLARDRSAACVIKRCAISHRAVFLMVPALVFFCTGVVFARECGRSRRAAGLAVRLSAGSGFGGAGLLLHRAKRRLHRVRGVVQPGSGTR